MRQNSQPTPDASPIPLDWPSSLPLDIRLVKRHQDMGLHSHTFSELVVILNGSAVHISPWGEYPISAGDVFVLHGDQAHGYRDTGELELANVLFRMDDLSFPLRDLETLSGYHTLFTLEPALRSQHGFESRLRLSPDQLIVVKERLRHLVIEREARSPGWQFALVAHFMLVVTDICRFYTDTDNPEVQSLLRLGTVIAHLHQHYSDNILLDDLAAIGCMSRRTLTREFTRAMGVSPIDYLIRERINRAVDLLHNDALTITEVAYQVGFQDSNYFTRKFHELTGHSPREIRRMIAGGQSANV